MAGSRTGSSGVAGEPVGGNVEPGPNAGGMKAGVPGPVAGLASDDNGSPFGPVAGPVRRKASADVPGNNSASSPVIGSCRPPGAVSGTAGSAGRAPFPAKGVSRRVRGTPNPERPGPVTVGLSSTGPRTVELPIAGPASTAREPTASLPVRNRLGDATVSSPPSVGKAVVVDAVAADADGSVCDLSRYGAEPAVAAVAPFEFERDTVVACPRFPIPKIPFDGPREADGPRGGSPSPAGRPRGRSVTGGTGGGLPRGPSGVSTGVGNVAGPLTGRAPIGVGP